MRPLTETRVAAAAAEAAAEAMTQGRGRGVWLRGVDGVSVVDARFEPGFAAAKADGAASRGALLATTEAAIVLLLLLLLLTLLLPLLLRLHKQPRMSREREKRKGKNER